MIIVEAQSSNEAWRKTFLDIYNNGAETDNEKYYRDEVTLIHIFNPQIEESDDLFPMNKEDLKIINRYIYTGENEDLVTHAWTKIYYHRAFDEPNSQVEYLISKLQEPEPTGESQISIWDKSIDQKAEIHPCTQILWARIKHGKLEFHTHANSSDAYKKLLMNIQEFIHFQHYIADRLQILVGDYYHFIDSCHIHYKDLDKVKELIAKM